MTRAENNEKLRSIESVTSAILCETYVAMKDETPLDEIMSQLLDTLCAVRNCALNALQSDYSLSDQQIYTIKLLFALVVFGSSVKNDLYDE